MDERLIDRAVVLWKRLLSAPKYQAVCDSSGPEDKRIMGMASKMAQMIPSNSTPELLDKFGDALKRGIIKTVVEQPRYFPGLHTDYGPDRILGDAAEEVGLKMEFPWKTNMNIRDDCVSVSAGYGSDYVYHYPLSGGRWLVTTLRQLDSAKVAELVEEGDADVFTIEVDEPATAIAP